MSLAGREERALARIEEGLRRSDPALTAMLSTFNRLNQSDEMPRREVRLRPTRMRGVTPPPDPHPDRRAAPAPLMQTRQSPPARPARAGRPRWFARSPRPSRLPPERTRD